MSAICAAAPIDTTSLVLGEDALLGNYEEICGEGAAKERGERDSVRERANEGGGREASIIRSRPSHATEVKLFLKVVLMGDVTTRIEKRPITLPGLLRSEGADIHTCNGSMAKMEKLPGLQVSKQFSR